MEVTLTLTILVPPVRVVAQVGELVLLNRSCVKKREYIALEKYDKKMAEAR